MSIHSELIGENVHQPKGANTASNGQVIKADGTGLTSWVDLFINRLLTASAASYTGSNITDNSGVETEETTIEAASDAVVNKNFHAIVTALNANNASLATQITALNSKLNEVITLLQDLNIARGA